MNILVYGLKDDEIQIVKESVPSRTCNVIDTCFYTDLIAINAIALIINPKKLADDELECILSFYQELGSFSEKVIFIYPINLSDALKNKILTYSGFQHLEHNLKYLLLSAYRKTKRSEQFSKNIANSLSILNLIRKQPGIKTVKLAEGLELSERTIQRYIETLRVAGEWIEYDSKLKGWTLFKGKSVFWGDFDE